MMCRIRGWYWAAPFLLTLLVIGYGLGQAQPWRDELATWSASNRSLGDLLRLIGTIDAVNGPYYLLMLGWTATFGDSIVALRAPALMAMSGAAALTAVLGQRLFGPRAGLLAGLIFAVIPSTARYGQEARSYALATLLAILATLLLVEALRQPLRWRWIAYGGAVAALGMVHLIALTLLAGHGVTVLINGQNRKRRRIASWAAAVTPAVLVVAIPLLLVGHKQQARQLDWVDPATLGDLAALPGAVIGSGAVGGLLLGLAALGAASQSRWGIPLGLCVLLPTGLLFIAGLFIPLWVPRYLVYTAPFGCLLAGAVLAPLRITYALSIITIAAGLGVPTQAALRRSHEWPRGEPLDYQGAARIIAAGQRPGDAIIYSPREGWRFLDLGITYHLRHHVQPRDVLVVRDQRQRADFWASECPQPARCLTGTDRVWLLVAGRPADPLGTLPDAKRDPLRDGYQLAGSWRLSGLTLILLVAH